MALKMLNKSPLEITDKIFYEDNDFDLEKVQLYFQTLCKIQMMVNCIQSTKSESFSFDDGRMKNIAYDSKRIWFKSNCR